MLREEINIDRNINSNIKRMVNSKMIANNQKGKASNKVSYMMKTLLSLHNKDTFNIFLTLTRITTTFLRIMPVIYTKWDWSIRAIKRTRLTLLQFLKTRSMTILTTNTLT